DYQAGVDLLRRAADAQPADVQAQTNLAYGLKSLGAFLFDLLDFPQAADRFEQVIAILQRLDEQGKVKGQQQIRELLSETQSWLRVSRLAAKAVVDPDFDSKQPADLPRPLRFVRLQLFLQERRTADAADWAEKLLASNDKTGETFYDA